MDTHVKWVQDAHLPPRDGDEVAPSEYHDAMKALVKENAQLLADLRRVRGAIADYLRPGNDKIADTWAVVEQINKEKMP